jgi:mannan endo-1,4-beta-mannosidase
MNGNWYPWSMNSTANDYILAWRHIHDILLNKSLDSTRLQWVWCVSSTDAGSYTAENYWVGDNYVDWLGIDGYNFGTSQSWSTWLWPNQIFDNMITRLRSLSSTKPICINEYGTSSIRTGNISDIQSKIDWLDQFCNYMDNNQIKMASYFNIDKETDWAIFGGMGGDVIWNNVSAYSSYKNCLQSNTWILSDSTNVRIITDEQFTGRSKINYRVRILLISFFSN